MQQNYTKLPLSYPLPNRQWIKGENGWFSVEWTPETRRIAMESHYKLVRTK